MLQKLVEILCSWMARLSVIKHQSYLHNAFAIKISLRFVEFDSDLKYILRMQIIKNKQDSLKRYMLPDNTTYKAGLLRQYDIQQWNRIGISEKDP